MGILSDFAFVFGLRFSADVSFLPITSLCIIFLSRQECDRL